MKGCMNALTFLVILAVTLFIVLAIIGWIRDGGSDAADTADQVSKSVRVPAVVEVFEVF
ncbi:hypothetical protein AAG612_05770 [Citromicrobium bathyomarinum]|uniref:hypothetical protein n=1 Tax=Citromicrobium bathyomarinum TaxID=72174 RepID=UPI0031599EE5